MILSRYFANGPLLGRVNAVVGHNNHLVQYNDLGQFIIQFLTGVFPKFERVYWIYHFDLNNSLYLGVKELSLCHKLKTSTTYIFAIRLCKPLIFQTMII